jgi:hypothetical protein
MSIPGSLWIDGTTLRIIAEDGFEYYYEGAVIKAASSNALIGSIWIEGSSIMYVDSSKNVRQVPTELPSGYTIGKKPGSLWLESNTIHWIDETGIERYGHTDTHSDNPQTIVYANSVTDASQIGSITQSATSGTNQAGSPAYANASATGYSHSNTSTSSIRHDDYGGAGNYVYKTSPGTSTLGSFPYSPTVNSYSDSHANAAAIPYSNVHQDGTWYQQLTSATPMYAYPSGPVIGYQIYANNHHNVAGTGSYSHDDSHVDATQTYVSQSSTYSHTDSYYNSIIDGVYYDTPATPYSDTHSNTTTYVYSVSNGSDYTYTTAYSNTPAVKTVHTDVATTGNVYDPNTYTNGTHSDTIPGVYSYPYSTTPINNTTTAHSNSTYTPYGDSVTPHTDVPHANMPIKV